MSIVIIAVLVFCVCTYTGAYFDNKRLNKIEERLLSLEQGVDKD